MSEAYEALCTWDTSQLRLWRATQARRTPGNSGWTEGLGPLEVGRWGRARDLWEVLEVARIVPEFELAAVVFLPDGLACCLRDGTARGPRLGRSCAKVLSFDLQLLSLTSRTQVPLQERQVDISRRWCAGRSGPEELVAMEVFKCLVRRSLGRSWWVLTFNCC